MFIVWYGDKGHDFLVQTDNVAEVRARAEKRGYVVKDIVKNS